MRTAVMLDDLDVLCNIDKLTSQVTGIRRFKRGIGKTFTCTVSGDEVLNDIQTLFEVRSNRCFNNLSTWLCHQTTHTSKLTNLCCRTSRP